MIEILKGKKQNIFNTVKNIHDVNCDSSLAGEFFFSASLANGSSRSKMTSDVLAFLMCTDIQPETVTEG